ncbi:MAG: hypothetical protein JO021_11275 [Alphaproteobacteria bacterium]|nr:hypothetical protein [Alphaproteobacteria bacterium]
MKSLLIAASVAVMTVAGSAAFAASGSEGSPDNPMAGQNGFGNTQPGSSASSGGSMRDPGGNRTDSYTHAPSTGAANTHPNTGPQTGPAYGSGGATYQQGAPAPGYGTAPAYPPRQ